jgi:hypothetical protein
VAIEQVETGLKTSYVPKLGKVLPMKMVTRYLPIENKVRTPVKYDLAGGILLVRYPMAGADGKGEGKILPLTKGGWEGFFEGMSLQLIDH